MLHYPIGQSAHVETYVLAYGDGFVANCVEIHPPGYLSGAAIRISRSDYFVLAGSGSMRKVKAHP